MRTNKSIFEKLNEFIFKNFDKFLIIFDSVKYFNEENINDENFFLKIKEIETHFAKSTDPRNVHERTLGTEKTYLAAQILAGFNLTLYNCKYVDIGTGHCIQDVDSTLITKDNDYFNFIMDLCNILIKSISDSDKLDAMKSMLNDQYEIKKEEKVLACQDGSCIVSKKYIKS
jgi:hypothetical protein